LLVVRGADSDGRPANLELPPDSDPGRRALPDLGWSRLVTGEITALDVPADHLSILRKPAVDQVGKYVSEALG
jgi:thioesterase domain-containing protein